MSSSNYFQKAYTSARRCAKPCFAILDPVYGGRNLKNNEETANLVLQHGLTSSYASYIPMRPMKIQEREASKSSPPKCASASKAVIKTVAFNYNGTGGLEGAQIVSLKDKDHSGSSLKPLWRVEDTGMNFSQHSPLWGIVDAKYEISGNVSTLPSNVLWLPGYGEGVNLPINFFMNTSGGHFYSFAIRYMYGMLGVLPSHPTFDILGYYGHVQFSMYRKWLEPSTNAQDSAKISVLVWMT
jgi:hypothetical protein